MTSAEHADDSALDGDLLPDDHDRIAEDLEWMRLTYTLDYAARPNSWERPGDYPQAWDVRAYLDTEIMESEHDRITADDQGRVPVADAKVYVIPDVGAIHLWETLDAHSADLALFGEAFMAAGSRPGRLTVNGEAFFEGDLMIVSWIGVKPRFRGHRVGHQVLKAILHAVGRGTVLVALQAAPGLREGLEEGSAEHAREAAALGRYWSELGFRQLHEQVMILTYDDMVVMLADDDADDEDEDSMPLAAMSKEQLDAVFKELRSPLE